MTWTSMSRGATKTKDELSTFLMILCECVRYMENMENMEDKISAGEAARKHPCRGFRVWASYRSPPRDLYGSSPCRMKMARYPQDRKLGFSHYARL